MKQTKRLHFAFQQFAQSKVLGRSPPILLPIFSPSFTSIEIFLTINDFILLMKTLICKWMRTYKLIRNKVFSKREYNQGAQQRYLGIVIMHYQEGEIRYGRDKLNKSKRKPLRLRVNLFLSVKNVLYINKIQGLYKKATAKN